MTIPQALFELNDKDEARLTYGQQKERIDKKAESTFENIMRRYRLNVDRLLNVPISELVKMAQAVNADLRKYPPDEAALDAERKKYAGVV